MGYKRLTPGTIEHALDELKGHYGIEDTAVIVGRSESTVYDWINSDDKDIPYKKAILLESKYYAEKGRRPLFHAGEKLFKRLTGDKVYVPESFGVLSNKTAMGCTRLIERCLQAVCPKGDMGEKISPNERHELRTQIHELKGLIDFFEQALDEQDRNIGGNA